MFVFVYGTLKEGRGNDYLLKDAELIGNAYTVDQFVLTDCGFPYLFEKEFAPVSKQNMSGVSCTLLTKKSLKVSIGLRDTIRRVISTTITTGKQSLLRRQMVTPIIPSFMFVTVKRIQQNKTSLCAEQKNSWTKKCMCISA